jgi:hypothetical protein
VATILLKLIGQVDDADGFEGAFFDADAASAAKGFGYDGVIAFYSDGFYSAAYHGAVAYAELVAFFDFAFVGV